MIDSVSHYARDMDGSVLLLTVGHTVKEVQEEDNAQFGY
jgi:hypothetical protein